MASASDFYLKHINETNMKKIFIIDWLLLVAFAVLTISGVVMHILHDYYGQCFCFRSPVMNFWDTTHIVAAITFTLAILLHFYQHLAWYKSLVKSGLGRRSKVSVLLSVVVFVPIITGAILWFGPCNNHLGLWHMWISLVMGALILYHIVKRWKVLVKSLKR
jgi:hypothetical protein